MRLRLAEKTVDQQAVGAVETVAAPDPGVPDAIALQISDDVFEILHAPFDVLRASFVPIFSGVA